MKISSITKNLEFPISAFKFYFLIRKQPTSSIENTISFSSNFKTITMQIVMTCIVVVAAFRRLDVHSSGLPNQQFPCLEKCCTQIQSNLQSQIICEG